jgi:hypothetical protein
MSPKMYSRGLQLSSPEVYNTCGSQSRNRGRGEGGGPLVELVRSESVLLLIIGAALRQAAGRIRCPGRHWRPGKAGGRHHVSEEENEL